MLLTTFLSGFTVTSYIPSKERERERGGREREREGEKGRGRDGQILIDTSYFYYPHAKVTLLQHCNNVTFGQDKNNNLTVDNRNPAHPPSSKDTFKRLVVAGWSCCNARSDETCICSPLVVPINEAPMNK